jgi:murein DD-endopeptidase MepM/ murein hydrolase activator NlpD
MNKLFSAALLGIAFLSFSFIKHPPAKKISHALVFPVSGKKSNIGSFWGASRDGGERRHEGIDIFARKGTPVVAISDGYIVSRGKSPRAGKFLWLQPSGRNWTAYNAHLDVQSVKEGQFVKKGQVIGTVGNTGNARYTPSHLHFGIYKGDGAVNPLPFVKNLPKITAPKASSRKKPAVARSKYKKPVRAKSRATASGHKKRLSRRA